MALLNNNLGGDAGFGEGVLGANDDGSTAVIDITSVFRRGLNFYGERYTSLYVNNNGSVTFEGPVSAYTPNQITEGSAPGLFTFWGDVDTRGGSLSGPSGGGNSQGTNLVYYDLDTENRQMTITWDDVGYYSAHTDLVNAFQLVITDLSPQRGYRRGDFSFEFRYEEISWTTGDASSGSGGLGGVVAHAGWSAGNGEDFFELPGSGDQASILALDSAAGNAGVAGLWQFQVVGGERELKTAAELFAEVSGKNIFLANLALAAYRLDVPGGEVQAPLVNDYDANGSGPVRDNAYTVLSGQLELLDDNDLPELTHEVTGAGNFPRTGLSDGIFTNGNAAALVGRSSDALFLAFRGTNDAATATGGPLAGDTPDKAHWTSTSAHFALFADLLAALRTYIDDDANGIERVYVTGHSLGASMGEALMDTWGDANIEAILFASPGYGIAVNSDDARITNFWIDGDPILGASVFADNEGDENTVYHGLEEGTDFADGSSILHSMILYQQVASFIASHGIKVGQLSGNLKGVNYDNIYLDIQIENEASETFRVGQDAATITGQNNWVASNNDLILGGARGDKLVGNKGKDFISGGGGGDKIFGGIGKDFLKGGNGRDVFVFKSIKETNSKNGKANADQILDWDNGGRGDYIDISKIDAKTGRPGNQKFKFIGDVEFSETKGELRFDKVAGKTFVFGDTNGDGDVDFAIRVNGLHDLTANDFIL